VVSLDAQAGKRIDNGDASDATAASAGALPASQMAAPAQPSSIAAAVVASSPPPVSAARSPEPANAAGLTSAPRPARAESAVSTPSTAFGPATSFSSRLASALVTVPVPLSLGQAQLQAQQSGAPFQQQQQINGGGASSMPLANAALSSAPDGCRRDAAGAFTSSTMLDIERNVARQRLLFDLHDKSVDPNASFEM